MPEPQPKPYGIKGIRITPVIHTGWNRRRRGSHWPEPIYGWRLLLHRILWGFNELVYIKPVRLVIEWVDAQ